MARIEIGAVAQQGPALTLDRAREICFERNRWAARVGFDRWYLANDRDGIVSIETRDGLRAEEVRKAFKGWRPDYVNWPQDKLDGEFRIIKHIARMGMPEYEFRDTCLASP